MPGQLAINASISSSSIGNGATCMRKLLAWESSQSKAVLSSSLRSSIGAMPRGAAEVPLNIGCLTSRGVSGKAVRLLSKAMPVRSMEPRWRKFSIVAPTPHSLPTARRSSCSLASRSRGRTVC
jgi:hypothetical protein